MLAMPDLNSGARRCVRVRLPSLLPSQCRIIVIHYPYKVDDIGASPIAGTIWGRESNG